MNTSGGKKHSRAVSTSDDDIPIPRRQRKVHRPCPPPPAGIPSVPSPSCKPEDKLGGTPESKNEEVRHDAIRTPRRRPKLVRRVSVSPSPASSKLGTSPKNVYTIPNHVKNRKPHPRRNTQQSKRRVKDSESEFELSEDSEEDSEQKESEGFKSASETSQRSGDYSGSEFHSAHSSNGPPSEKGLDRESGEGKEEAPIGHTVISAMQEGRLGEEEDPPKPIFEPMSIEER